ncbi:hypothetical protein [Meiothermus taiwanensis]|jgi:hypothetical protein|uniref:PIN domain-containing protein n=2 Tax=Meiothermus taiwanensis TaxID=172827 RepID=A0A399EAK2_9DEIN|nr:hypothetical protein [Meiothermus taiwanensis]AWR86766.1 hypothetical protein Mtai_v1c15250 [Meiothermus taiwanensis WR-220]KIQ55302.1 hypothetical protein SY28_04020 [Meiothermus taiwanensis]KZK15605.1 hypothetical protein A3962_09550 [Meiothermus taiwanensis]RIH79062.1 hypothetical protein Mcate_00580 [Meiothermus taiwanensis]
MPSRRPVLDTNALRHFSFAHPQGLDILLSGIGSNKAYFPAEVYNQDEGLLPLDSNDEELSELARGLRWAQRSASRLTPGQAKRCWDWLNNSRQIRHHLERGSLVIDPLTLGELHKRVRLEEEFGIERGEAACLVLAQRYGSVAVFTSTDKAALRAAQRLGVKVLSGMDILSGWIKSAQPSRAGFDGLIAGLREAKYGLREEDLVYLRSLIQRI